MEEKEKRPVRGIRIRSFNYIMILVSFLLYVLLIAATVYTSVRYEALQDATGNYIACEENAALVAKGSDYLTEQVRLYVITSDFQYVDGYFTEAHITRRRDMALDQLSAYPLDEEILSSLHRAMECSNLLMEQEFYAMRLTAEAQSFDLSAFPEEIRNTPLTEEDAGLAPEEMRARARELVFGTDYQTAKAEITSHISHFLDGVLTETQGRQEDSALALRRILRQQQLLVSILFLQTILTFILITRLIVKPLHVYINNIREEKQLEITGAYEFRYLALTYNNIYELNTANENMLRYRAEHGPLTGIMNRGAFDHLKELLRAKASPLALLIIDVDKFKLINDGYGHETGDRVLQKVASLLEENFRSTDYTARIGGDEFAVIVTDITPATKSVIDRKIRKINEALLHPEDGLPQVSLSVGGALSACGFSDDLYQKADVALYEVKENGRCGFRFHE